MKQICSDCSMRDLSLSGQVPLKYFEELYENGKYSAEDILKLISKDYECVSRCFYQKYDNDCAVDCDSRECNLEMCEDHYKICVIEQKCLKHENNE